MSRRPAAFSVPSQTDDAEQKPPAKPARKPRAVGSDSVVTVTAPEDDYFNLTELAEAPPPVPQPPRRAWLFRAFLSALGILFSLAFGIWTDRLIRDLFARSDWLGWLGLAMAAIALVALIVMLLREFVALRRLTSVEALRSAAASAMKSNDANAARDVVSRLRAMVTDKPQTAAGRAAIDLLRGEIVDGVDLIPIAERELLAPLDRLAHKQVLDAAKRVSIVTAVSPRAMVDLAYVLFEAARLTRRIAEIYGARPGFFGFLHLMRSIVTHLAVTGSMAAGETVVQQIVGHGIAARLSAKLGEGVVNGMMTARIGVAAMAAARPLAFNALPRPGLGDIFKAITRFAAAEGEKGAEKPDRDR